MMGLGLSNREVFKWTHLKKVKGFKMDIYDENILLKQLLFAKNEITFEKLVTDCEYLSKRISNFISYLNKKEYKGTKFKS